MQVSFILFVLSLSCIVSTVLSVFKEGLTKFEGPRSIASVNSQTVIHVKLEKDVLSNTEVPTAVVPTVLWSDTQKGMHKVDVNMQCLLT